MSLKGGFTFTADLIRELTPLDVRVDFMSVSSYGDELKSSGVINIKQDISTDISGKNIIIIDDIVDTGRTLFEIRNYLLRKIQIVLEHVVFWIRKKKESLILI